MPYGAVCFLFFLTGCSATAEIRSDRNNARILPERLLHCDLRNYTPKALPAIRTPRMLAEYANRLEASREEIIIERNKCDRSREEIVHLYLETGT